MRCREARSRLTALVDGELGRFTAWRVRRHARRCARCGRALAYVTRLVAVARAFAAGAGSVVLAGDDRATATGPDCPPGDCPPPAGARGGAGAIGGARTGPREPLPPPGPPGPTQRPAAGLVALAAMPLAVAAGVAVTLLFALSPARALERRLERLSRVRAAHAVGWQWSYREAGSDRRPPVPQSVEYWYRAPASFRRSTRGGAPHVATVPADLLLHGGRAFFVLRGAAADGRVIPASVADLRPALSPFDLFSPEGFMQRALRRGGARVARASGGRVTLSVGEGRGRQRWLLRFESGTDRVAAAECTVERRLESGWRLELRERIDRIEYDVPIGEQLFAGSGGAGE